MAVGDFDSDGQMDLALGAPGKSYRGDDWLPGRVLVFFGPISGYLQSGEADISCPARFVDSFAPRFALRDPYGSASHASTIG